MTHVKPDAHGFSVALQALADDAALWDGGNGKQGSSQHLHDAATRAGTLGISDGAFILSWDVLVVYRQVWGRFVERVQQGAQGHHEVGANLRDARTTYMKADEAAKHDFYHTW